MLTVRHFSILGKKHSSCHIFLAKDIYVALNRRRGGRFVEHVAAIKNDGEHYEMDKGVVVVYNPEGKEIAEYRIRSN